MIAKKVSFILVAITILAILAITGFSGRAMSGITLDSKTVASLSGEGCCYYVEGAQCNQCIEELNGDTNLCTNTNYHDLCFKAPGQFVNCGDCPSYGVDCGDKYDCTDEYCKECFYVGECYGCSGFTGDECT